MIPAWDKLIGHGPVTLASGEVVTVQVGDSGDVVLALYEISDEQPAGDAPVMPAPVISMLADEAELISGLLTLGAVTSYGLRRRLHTEEETHDEDGDQRS
jgi:hypothetical protein